MSFKWKSEFSRQIFRTKYAIGPNDDWPNLARRVVDSVCGTRGGTTNQLLSNDELHELEQFIMDMKFIPGGRYLYYAGRELSFYNNCFALKAEEDTREEWGNILKRASDCLMSGGGIGVDYSIIRPSGRVLRRTGGVSSGPLPLMCSVNEVGRNVMQGGSRRSAIFASLNWQHEDIESFLYAKDWPEEIRQLKERDFNFPAQLDMTNISINWDTSFANTYLESAETFRHSQPALPKLWYGSVKQMCKTAEPGHCYNFWENEKETLRNA